MHSETVAYWITKYFNKGLCYRDIQYVLKHKHSICFRLRHLQLQRRNYHYVHAAVNFIQMTAFWIRTTSWHRAMWSRCNEYMELTSK